ncbi:MAG: plasmid pRiA4b ORF-3 family protein [Paludibacteraceae bacterium]|nr:plasmid pRiA4b ORF-3 family protein [Paludibacteraceae bacterium]
MAKKKVKDLIPEQEPEAQHIFDAMSPKQPEEMAKEDGYPHFLKSDNVQKYTLRVTLKGIKPAIYRKFCVPSNICLRHLSELIMDLMGWGGGHLNQFRKGDDYYAPSYQRTDDTLFFDSSHEFNQEDYRISDILSDKGKSIEWEYDFGDSWCHEVRLSSIGDYASDEKLVSFVKGERACPPEDCGGIWGYEDLLEIYYKCQKYALGAGKRPTKDELDNLEWYGMDGGFSPETFDSDFACEICDGYC